MNGLTLLLFLTICVISCKQKEEEPTGPRTYTCTAYYNKQGLSIGYIGFTLEELDTIVYTRYRANTGLATPLYERAVYPYLKPMRNDTADYDSGGAPFASLGLNDTFDYKITIPGAGVTYTVRNIGFFPLPTTYKNSNPCKMLYFPVAPDSALVDNQVVYTRKPWENYPPRYLYLHR